MFPGAGTRCSSCSDILGVLGRLLPGAPVWRAGRGSPYCSPEGFSSLPPPAARSIFSRPHSSRTGAWTCLTRARFSPLSLLLPPRCGLSQSFLSAPPSSSCPSTHHLLHSLGPVAAQTPLLPDSVPGTERRGETSEERLTLAFPQGRPLPQAAQAQSG